MDGINGLKIQEGKFYVLKLEGESWIYGNEDDAINALKKLLAKSNDSSPENASLLEVQIVGDEWKIKQVPWSKIAIRLIKSGCNHGGP
ncbi:MAG: hypothetical protein QXH03_06200 [Candidatus Bathyarchaeia archaeon]